jgi:opacity protein-like surface antigen
MFRKTSVLAGALALMLVAPLAHAAKGDMSIGLGGGVSVPMSDFKDFAKLGFLGGASFDYMVNDMVAVGVDGSYVLNKAKDELIAADSLTDAKLTIMQFGAHAKYMFPLEGSSLSPYVVVGAGMFRGKYDQTPDDPNFPETSESKFGGRVGAGLGFKAGEKATIGVEANFNHVATEGTSTQYVSVLGRVSFAVGGSK